MSATINEDDEDDVRPPPPPPELARRKSSFSETLNKFASNHFGRRRTATNLSHSESSGNIYQNSRLPTASGIPRSSSFFGNFGAFSKHNTPGNGNGLSNNGATPPPAIKPSRKISERLASTPFFKNQHPQHNTTAPVDPAIPKGRRDSGVQIKHHGLMMPINPPLPRSNTMGNLGQPGSPRIPSFMRPTTSSAARRESVVMQQGQKHTPPPVPRVKHRLSLVSEISTLTPSTPTQKRTFAEKAANNTERALPRLIMEEDGQRTSTPITLAASASPPNSAKELEDKVLAWKLGHPKPTTTEETTPLLSEPATAMPDVDDWKYKPVGRRPSRPSLPRNYSMPFATPDDNSDNTFMGDEDRRKYELAKQAMQTDATPTKKNRNFLNLTLAGSESDHVKKDLANIEPVPGERSIGVGSVEEKDEIGFEYDSDDSLAVNPAAISKPLPSSTWLGRLTSLSDRYRTEALLEASPRTSASHPMHNDTLRYSRAFTDLYALCTSLEAKKSLAEFKRAFDNRWAREESGQTAVVSGVLKKRTGADEGLGANSAVKDKKGVFEKLGLTGVGKKKGGF